MKYLFVLIFLVSCSSLQQRRDDTLINDLYKSKSYKDLAAKITKKSLYSNEKDRFLKASELGLLFFRIGDYEESLKNFRVAKQIAESLYTVRVSKKLASYLASSSDDIYYPNPFELTQIRFYELMAHLMMSQVEDQKKATFHRGALESTLRDWHAYVENDAFSKQGEALFKGTVLADVMAVIIHNFLGSSKDISQARSFKKIARKNLLQKMGLYKSFNVENEKYTKAYSKLHLKSIKDIKKNFYTETGVYKDIESFTKGNYKQVVIILDGLIAPKRPEKYNFPLDLLALAKLPSADKTDFVNFSSMVLRLSSGSNPTISFELPKVSSVPYSVNKNVELLKDGKVYQNPKSILLSNSSEILGQMIKEEASAVKVKTGTRLAVKHVAILLAAYTTYKTLLKKQGQFLAYAAATASYAVANKSLAAMEKADLRSLKGLHNFVKIIPLNLDKGQYKIRYKGSLLDIKVTGAKKQIIPLVL